jgi:hypothetical protein
MPTPPNAVADNPRFHSMPGAIPPPNFNSLIPRAARRTRDSTVIGRPRWWTGRRLSWRSSTRSRNQGEQYAALKPWLTGDAPGLSRAEAARALEMSEGALKVAIHRLRKRFREMVKAEIGQTVSDPAEVREELRYLIEVLATPQEG